VEGKSSGRLAWVAAPPNVHPEDSRELAARLKIRDDIPRLNLTQHLAFLHPTTTICVSLSLQRLSCPCLFICPRHASQLGCHLTPRLTHLRSTLHSPCHVLQMAIVSITCDAYSPVCLLYQLLVALFFFFSFLFLFFFFHNKQLLGSSTLSEVYNITASQHLDTHHLNRQYRHCEVIRVIRPTSRVTHNNPAERLG
jgi:hypothetical protein